MTIWYFMIEAMGKIVGARGPFLSRRKAIEKAQYIWQEKLNCSSAYRLHVGSRAEGSSLDLSRRGKVHPLMLSDLEIVEHHNDMVFKLWEICNPDRDKQPQVWYWMGSSGDIVCIAGGPYRSREASLSQLRFYQSTESIMLPIKPTEWATGRLARSREELGSLEDLKEMSDREIAKEEKR